MQASPPTKEIGFLRERTQERKKERKEKKNVNQLFPFTLRVKSARRRRSQSKNFNSIRGSGGDDGDEAFCLSLSLSPFFTSAPCYSRVRSRALFSRANARRNGWKRATKESACDRYASCFRARWISRRERKKE